MEKDRPQSPPDERKHIDESPNSPMEERDDVENVEQLPESMSPVRERESLQSPGEEEIDGGGGGGGEEEDDPVRIQRERSKKFLEQQEAFWTKHGVKFPNNGAKRVPVSDSDSDSDGEDIGKDVCFF